MGRTDWTFLGLVITQAVHSIEEYAGRLWDRFPPARFVSGMVSFDLRYGFLILNVLLVAFGAWCFLWPVRKRWRTASGFLWLWVIIETINGLGHSLWALSQRHYTPGLLTAPFLLLLALLLGRRLVDR